MDSEIDLAAHRMLVRLSAFAAELEPRERVALAALLAPGLSAAMDNDEVTGFDYAPCVDASLNESVRNAVREYNLGTWLYGEDETGNAQPV